MIIDQIKWFLFFILISSTTVWAQTSTLPTIGDGSPENPYQIGTLDNLYWLSQNSSEWDKHFIQTADIDASDTENWDGGSGFTPIGATFNRFSGTYNGDGHKITGIYINRPWEVNGLFSHTATTSTIKNLGVENVEILEGHYLGGLVGANLGKIINCYSTGNVRATIFIQDGKRIFVGGLVATNNGNYSDDNDGTISNSYSTVTVSGDEFMLVGGLVGVNGNEAEIINSYAEGNVDGVRNVGGLVGSNGSYGIVVDSYSTGDVNGDVEIGGLVGSNEKGIIENSYSTSDVTGNEEVGGLVGYNDGTTGGFNHIKGSTSSGIITGTQYVGGLVGRNWEGKISNSSSEATVNGEQGIGGLIGSNFDFGDISTSSATGSVNGNSNVGGLVGNNDMSSRIDSSFATGNVTGGSVLGGLVGENGREAKIANSFATGSVDAGSDGGRAGGLVGSNRGSGTFIKNSYATGNVYGNSSLGGLIGSNSNSAEITNSYSIGEVENGEFSIGGLVGGGNFVVLNNSYWNLETSGQHSSEGGIGLTTAEMLQQDSFEGWDFSSGGVWSINEEETYPYLQWQETIGEYNYPSSILSPTYLNGETSEGVVNLTWQVPSLGSPLGYNIYRDDQLINTESLLTNTEYTDEIENLISYKYYVTAVWDENGQQVESLSTNSVEIIPVPFVGGIGTEDDPWQIDSGDQLTTIRDLLDAHFILVADIDLSFATSDPLGNFWNEGKGWDPIGGPYPNEFTGSLIGNDFTIIGLSIDRPSENYVGLFAATHSNAVLHNVKVKEIEIKGNSYIGGLVGKNSGKVTESSSEGNINGNNDYIGGLLGYNSTHSISNSNFSGSVSGNGQYTGGLVGIVNNGSISSSYSIGNVSGDEKVGGLAGYSNDITKSYSSGEITGNGYVGGLVGEIGSFTVSNSYSTVDVINIGQYTGGLIGFVVGGTISNSYSMGSISGGSRTGGFIGGNFSGIVNNSFWNTETSGQNNGIGSGDQGDLTGLTIDQMKVDSSFSGFDFEINWSINEGFTFPYLQQTAHRISITEITGREGWRMMSTGLKAITFDSLLSGLWTQGFPGSDYPETGAANVFVWNEADSSWSPPTHALDIPDRGSGMIVFVYSDEDYDGSSEGFPKSIIIEGENDTSAVNISLSYTDLGSQVGDGWNLIGNPFSFPIDWDAPNGWKKTGITNSIYIWSNSEQAYQTWNGSVGSLESGIIAPWQGFWVKADNSETPSISMSEEIRSTGGTFLKTNSVPVLELKLENENKNNSAFITMNPKAKFGIDVLDAFKLTPLSSDFLTLYTLTEDDIALDINALPNDLEGSIKIPLDFDGTDLNSELELYVEERSFPDDWKFLLRDNKTGIEIDLAEQPNYKFQLSEKEINKSPKYEKKITQYITKPKLLKSKSTGQEYTSRFVLTIISGQSVSTEQRNDVPNNFALRQNYPNPFNPTTQIRYGIPQPAEVELKVYNMLGQEVATLVNGKQSAGWHTATFDAAGLSSGFYIYRIKAGSFVESKKLMLIK